jgi:hypothetical protein
VKLLRVTRICALISEVESGALSRPNCLMRNQGAV